MPTWQAGGGLLGGGYRVLCNQGVLCNQAFYGNAELAQLNFFPSMCACERLVRVEAALQDRVTPIQPTCELAPLPENWRCPTTCQSSAVPPAGRRRTVTLSGLGMVSEKPKNRSPVALSNLQQGQ